MTKKRYTSQIIPAVILALAALVYGCTGPGSPGGGGGTVSDAETPVILPAEGIIANFTSISITTGTPGAAIYYTTDGTDPTVVDVYTGPFTLTAGSLYTVKAFARLDGLNDSAISSAEYTVVDQAAPVTYADPDGAIPDNRDIVLSTATPGATIYYTWSTDGNPPAEPTSADTEYTGPFTMAVLSTDTLSIRAIATLAGSADSEVTQVDYTKAVSDAPVSDRTDGSTISDSMTITLSSTTPSSSIYYTFTTDGSVPADPTAASTLYTVPLAPGAGSYNFKAIASAAGYTDSSVTSVGLNVIAQAQAGVPTIVIPPGFVPSGTDVSLSVSGGETIYYTIDGSDPAVSGIEYTTPIDLTASATLRAYAAGVGFYPSAEAAAEYMVYESIDTLAADTGALIAVSASGGVVLRAGGKYYDLISGSLTARTVTEPAGTVLDFTIDASGDLHALYLNGTTLSYWTSDDGTIGTLSTVVTLADARIVLDSTGSARIVFAETDDVVEAIYTSAGVGVGVFTQALLTTVRGLDAALDSTDRLYIAVARTKNTTQTTRIGYFDAGVWTEYLPEVNNRSNPALMVESDDSLLLAYVRTDKDWFYLNDFTADTRLAAVVTQSVPGDTNMAFDSSGSLYISSHDSAWIMNADETALDLSVEPYRIASDPSGSEKLYMLGTKGLTLYVMK